MKVKLSNGFEFSLGVSHTTYGGRRATKAWLRQDNFTPPLQEEGLAVCSESDNFCKRSGRRLAAIRLLAKLSRYRGPGNNPLFTKEDRRAVFKAVCPEYAKV